MNLKSKLILVALAFIVIMIPLNVYSSDTNDTGGNITNSSVTDSNNLSANSTKLLNVPDVQEPSNYTGGPAALQAVLSYYGSDVKVDKLINLTNTTPENGTLPGNIAEAATQMGFNADIKLNMTLKDLQGYINNGTPVIVDIQAYRNDSNLTQNWTEDISSSYMVVIGVDDQNVYLEDPVILGSRGYIPNQEFLDRWHDKYTDPKTGENITNSHLGIVITGKEAPVRPLIIKIN
jgi:uncharacterized protein